MTKADNPSDLAEAAAALDRELKRFEALSEQAGKEIDAAALVARAQQIAARRLQFTQLLERMGGLGQTAREAQELLREGTGRLDEVLERMQKVADDEEEGPPLQA